MYVYKSPIGLMMIRYDSNVGKFGLIINSICYSHFDSVIAAADDVYCHMTGCEEWDKLHCQVDAPTDIYEWKRIK